MYQHFTKSPITIIIYNLKVTVKLEYKSIESKTICNMFRNNWTMFHNCLQHFEKKKKRKVLVSYVYNL